MSKRNHLLLGAALSVVSSFALAQPVLAQQAAPPKDAVIETPEAKDAAAAKDEDVIVVTGSRIKRDNFDNPFPTQVIGSEQIEARQFTNVVDALNELPFVGPASTRRGANTQFGDNFAFTDLLNCGSQRTLVLVNGRRFVPANQATLFVPENASGAQVDLSVLNPGFIERTDAVTGTGGVIYGADAVCGVVNVVTKSNYDGFNARLQGGLTEFGDGGEARGVLTWGKNLFKDRLNILVGVEYFHADTIRNGGGRPYQTAQGFRNNPQQGAIRNPAVFNVSEEITRVLAGGSFTTAFLPTTADNQSTTFFSAGPNRNPLFPVGGSIVTSQVAAGGAQFTLASTPIYPNVPLPSGFAAAGASTATPFSFFAPTSLPSTVSPAAVIAALAPGANTTGLTSTQLSALAINLLQRNRPTPLEYALANPNLNPLLFYARFQPSGYVPTIANTNPATNAAFPRIAVPLRLDPQGNLLPLNVGSFDPLTFPTVTSFVGGDGFSGDEYRTGNLQSGTDRGNFNLNTRFDITNNIRYKTENLWSEQRFRSNLGNQGLTPFSNANFNNGSVPLFINENPYLTDQARAAIASLQAQGLQLPTIGGQPVLFVATTTQELIRDFNSRNDVRTIRTAHIFEGDFNFLNRQFNWDAAFSYGRSRTRNFNPQRLDVENALATDTVRLPNGEIVCRQQTLAQPESIALRNPFLGAGNSATATQPAFNTNVPNALIPTAAQVASCVPVHPGLINVSQAAIDYIIRDIQVDNVSQQYYAAGQFGGDLVQLPGGPVSFSSQFEWRRESNSFQPSQEALLGIANNLVSIPTAGALRFFEGNYEGIVPIFGENFNLPGFKALQLEGTVRVVSRNQSTDNPDFASFNNLGSVTNITYNAGGRWSPYEGLTVRGYRSRTVRSASIVELYQGLQVATTTAANVCTPAQIGQGPNPTQRRANCIQAVLSTGAAANAAAAESFLQTFASQGGQISGSGGTPTLNNEIADTFTGGLTYRPKWVKNLVLSGDYISIDIKDLITSASTAVTVPTCFDTSDFAAGQFNPLCQFFVVGTQAAGSTQFSIPSVNPITGQALPPGAVAGTLAPNQAPFQTAYAFSPRINLASQQIRAINANVQYSFRVSDIVGSVANKWGSITLTGNAYWLRRYDIFTDGSAASLNPNAGDVDPTLATSMRITHKIGRLNHQLLWLRDNTTVGNVLTPLADYDEQPLGFVFPSTNTFNYSLEYQATDHISVGFVANDLTRATPLPQFDIVNNPIGRTFSLSVSAHF